MVINKEDLETIIDVFERYRTDLDSEWSSDLYGDELSLLIKLKEQLRLGVVCNCLPNKETLTFKEWKELNNVIQHDDGTYIYKGKPYCKDAISKRYNNDIR